MTYDDQMLILCLSYFNTTLTVYLKFLFNQWDCTNIPWIANNSLTIFSKAIRFGTIHILHQLGGSEKVQNYADVIYEWCIENIDYGYLMLSTSYLHSTSGASRNAYYWCFYIYIYILEYFLIIFLLTSKQAGIWKKLLFTSMIRVK